MKKHVASFQSCKQLYSITKWRNTYFVYRWFTNWPLDEQVAKNQLEVVKSSGALGDFKLPAYDSDFLFDRLEGLDVHCVYRSLYNRWYAWIGDSQYQKSATRPATALALLCIELAKKGYFDD